MHAPSLDYSQHGVITSTWLTTGTKTYTGPWPSRLPFFPPFITSRRLAILSQCHVTFCLWRIEPFPFQHTITFPYYLVTSCRLTLLDELYNKTPAVTSPSEHKTAAVTFSFRNHTLLPPYLISRDHIVSSHIPPPHSYSTLTSVSSFVVPHLSNNLLFLAHHCS